MKDYLQAKMELFKQSQEISNNIKILALLEESISKDLSELNQDLERTKLYHQNIIAQSMGDDHKPLYKNEQIREYELDRRLYEDARYKDLKSKKKEKGIEYGKVKIEREYEERNFKIVMRALEE